MSHPAPASPAASAPVHYVGFWARVLASIIDTIALGLLLLVLGPLLGLSAQIETGADGLPVFNAHYWQGLGVNQLLGAALVIGFWLWKMATPGKMVISAVIVDAKTLGKPSVGQACGRYLAYFVSIFAFMLGFLWVAFDPRKQGWHDKMAGTLVIRKPVA